MVPSSSSTSAPALRGAAPSKGGSRSSKAPASACSAAAVAVRCFGCLTQVGILDLVADDLVADLDGVAPFEESWARA